MNQSVGENMKIYVLDDEPIALQRSVKIIQQVEPGAEIAGFGRAKAVFEQITQRGEAPDIVFSDIEMPGMTGLEFAVRMKQLCPDTILIFVTAYSQYALDAFRLHVHGYILKPLTEDRVREELEYALKQIRENINESPLTIDQNGQDRISKESKTEDRRPSAGITGPMEMQDKNTDRLIEDRKEKLQVQCFGYFEVFWEGEPLMFSRRQTKELLAYLIDRKGASCTAEEIAGALWENEGNMKNLKSRIRILISDLKRVLESIGKEDLILRRSGQIAIRREGIDCDYYRMLAGDMDAVNSFRGEYMVQYSWAEVTAGQLTFGMEH